MAKQLDVDGLCDQIQGLAAAQRKATVADILIDLEDFATGYAERGEDFALGFKEAIEVIRANYC